jgi:hypothetical protein
MIFIDQSLCACGDGIDQMGNDGILGRSEEAVDMLWRNASAADEHDRQQRKHHLLNSWLNYNKKDALL